MTRRLACVVALVGVSLMACSSSDSDAPSSVDGGGDVTATPEGGDATTPIATQTVGASGGTVSASGVTITIPAGALPSDTVITIEPSAGVLPNGYTSLTSLFAFGPSGTVFLKPVAVDFTIPITGANPTVMWSNAQGGYDALATNVVATTASATITHFSNGFVADLAARPDGGADASSGADASTADSGMADSTSADAVATDAIADAGSTDAIADAGSTDAGFLGITATIDNVVTTFGANPTVTNNGNSVFTIFADDNATSTHWRAQLVLTSQPQQACTTSPQPAYPAVTYTHYTNGVADSVYTTKQTMGYCTIGVQATPVAAGDHARGTFVAGVDRAVDAGGGVHVFTNGSYDAIF